MSALNPYDVLGLGRDASPEQVKAAYRTLARRYHPDQVPDGEKEEAATHFQRITDAYQVLVDPERRARWDAQDALRTMPTPASASPVGVRCAICNETIDAAGTVSFSSTGEPCHPECLTAHRPEPAIQRPRHAPRAVGRKNDVTQDKRRLFLVMAILAVVLPLVVVFWNAESILEEAQRVGEQRKSPAQLIVDQFEGNPEPREAPQKGNDGNGDHPPLPPNKAKAKPLPSQPSGPKPGPMGNVGRLGGPKDESSNSGPNPAQQGLAGQGQ